MVVVVGLSQGPVAYPVKFLVVEVNDIVFTVGILMMLLRSIGSSSISSNRLRMLILILRLL